MQQDIFDRNYWVSLCRVHPTLANNVGKRTSLTKLNKETIVNRLYGVLHYMKKEQYPLEYFIKYLDNVLKELNTTDRNDVRRYLTGMNNYTEGTANSLLLMFMLENNQVIPCQWVSGKAYLPVKIQHKDGFFKSQGGEPKKYGRNVYEWRGAKHNVKSCPEWCKAYCYKRTGKFFCYKDEFNIFKGIPRKFIYWK